MASNGSPHIVVASSPHHPSGPSRCDPLRARWPTFLLPCSPQAQETKCTAWREQNLMGIAVEGQFSKTAKEQNSIQFRSNMTSNYAINLLSTDLVDQPTLVNSLAVRWNCDWIPEGPWLRHEPQLPPHLCSLQIARRWPAAAATFSTAFYDSLRPTMPASSPVQTDRIVAII